MAIEYGKLRAGVLDFLRMYPRGRANVDWNGDFSVLNFFNNRGMKLDRDDEAQVRVIFHELYLERVIVPGWPNLVEPYSMNWPAYRVTEHGAAALKSNEFTPYDPEGYLRRLRESTPGISPDVLRYVGEALDCFRANCLLASAVMLGCAAEKGLLELVEAFGNAISDPAKKASFEKDTRHWQIKSKYDALWKRLEPMASNLPKPLGDDLHTMLDRVFDLIRTTRNDAGHPSGKVMERETILANLILFPSYCRRIYGLKSHFSVS